MRGCRLDIVRSFHLEDMGSATVEGVYQSPGAHGAYVGLLRLLEAIPFPTEGYMAEGSKHCGMVLRIVAFQEIYASDRHGT